MTIKYVVKVDNLYVKYTDSLRDFGGRAQLTSNKMERKLWSRRKYGEWKIAAYKNNMDDGSEYPSKDHRNICKKISDKFKSRLKEKWGIENPVFKIEEIQV